MEVTADNLLLAYLAGYFDGDGSAGIYRSNDTNGCERVALVLKVRSLLPTVPALYKERFGGATYVTKTDTGRPYYAWGASSRVAARGAVLLAPFMCVRADQLRLIAEYHAGASAAGRNSSPLRLQALAARRLEFCQRMAALNKVGLSEPLKYAIGPLPMLPALLELSYLAGFCDADGTFHWWGKRIPAPTVSVTNIAEAPVLRMARYFGGNISVLGPRSDGRGRFQWSRRSEPAALVAQTLLPYLREKRVRAAEMAAWRPTSEARLWRNARKEDK